MPVFLCVYFWRIKHQRISGWWLQTTTRFRLKLQVYYSDHPVNGLVLMTGKPHNVKATTWDSQVCQRWHYHIPYFGSILNIWMAKTWTIDRTVGSWNRGALTQIRTPPWCSFVGKHLETTQMSNFYRLSQYKMIRFNHIKRIPSSCRISHPSSTISILGIWTSPAQKPWCGHGNWVGLDDPSGPAERTPKKPEYLIARSQLPEQGPLGFGPIQFLMDGWFLEQIITLPEN